MSGRVWAAPGTLLVTGHRTDYLPKAAREARRAAALLASALGRPVDVHAVLAIIAEDVVVKQQPSDVFVGPPRGVKRWLLGRPEELPTREVLAVCGIAAKPSTWRTGTRS